MFQKNFYQFSKVFILIVAFFVFSTSNLLAQNDTVVLVEQDILNVKHIVNNRDKNKVEVVSGSRSSKSIADLPITIYVIGREEILTNGYFTLADALKTVPGIRVSQPGSAEIGEIFQMRGLRGNSYVKILINNIPIKPSGMSGMPIEAQIPIRQAERIEISFGPASALYGGDATVGVVNIITKEANTGIFAQADIRVSSDNYANFHVGGKAGKNHKILKYSFYGIQSNTTDAKLNTSSDVFRPFSFLDQTLTPININGKDYYYSQLSEQMLLENGGLNFLEGFPNFEGTVDSVPFKDLSKESRTIGFDLKYKSFYLSVISMHRQTHSSVGRSTYLYKYNNPQNYIADNAFITTMGWHKKHRIITQNFNISLGSSTMDPNSNYGITFIENGDKLYQFSMSNDIFLEEFISYNKNFFEIVAGVSAQFHSDIATTNYLTEPFNFDAEKLFSSKTKLELHKDIDNFGINYVAIYELSTFVQTFFDFEKLKILLGARYDYNSLFVDGSLSPRISVIYKVSDNLSVRTALGTSFKPPPANVVFTSLSFDLIQDGDTGVYYTHVPNIELKPERFFSDEIGMRADFFNKKIQLDASVYFNRISNMITSDYVDPVELGYEKAINRLDQPARKNVNSSTAQAQIVGLSSILLFNNIFEKYKFTIEIQNTITLYATEVLPSGDRIQFYRGLPKNMGKVKISFSPFKKSYFSIYNYWSSGWKRSFLPSIDYYVNDYYPNIDGYFTIDFVAGYRIHKNLNLFLRITNLTNKEYAGLDATQTDVDLRYNIQHGRIIKLGMSFLLN